MARALSKKPSEILDHGFSVGELVWGKVPFQPWWPGQIYDEDRATLSTWINKKKGYVLVGFFGNKTYQWLDPDHVVPFESEFYKKSKQSQDVLFLKALEDALFQIKKTSALGLICKCRNPSNFMSSEVEGFFEVDAAGYAAGNPYTIEQIEKARSGFQPHEMVSFLQKLALNPNIDPQENVTWIENTARLLAYRKVVFEEYYEPYFQAFSVQATEDEHHPDVSYGKKKAHQEDITPNSLVYKEKGGTSKGKAPVAEPSVQRSVSAPKRVASSASPSSSKRFKDQSEDSDSLEVSFLAPDAMFFLSDSVSLERRSERQHDSLGDTAQSLNNSHAKNLEEEVDRAPFPTSVSNANILAEIVRKKWESSEPLEQKYNNLKDCSDLSGWMVKLQDAQSALAANNKKLEYQLRDTLQNQAQEIERAREEARLQVYETLPYTEEGQALLQANWESQKAEFLNSSEFKTVLQKKAASFYYRGFDSCQRQLAGHGYPPEGTKLDFLDREAGLDELLKEEKESGQSSTSDLRLPSEMEATGDAPSIPTPAEPGSLNW